MSSSITWYKDQVEIDVFFPFGKNLSAVEGFALALKQYTAAGISEVSYTQGSQINQPQNDTVDAYPLRNYAKVLMKRQSDGKIYGLLLYAPAKTLFEFQEGPRGGWRVKLSKGQELAALYAEHAGEPFFFYKGWLCGETYGEG